MQGFVARFDSLGKLDWIYYPSSLGATIFEDITFEGGNIWVVGNAYSGMFNFCLD